MEKYQMLTEQPVRSMADRINVDIEGLRERIEQAHADNPLWERLSMAQKLRKLIEDGLQLAEDKAKDQPNA